jgi:dihydroneopterin aldolase
MKKLLFLLLLFLTSCISNRWITYPVDGIIPSEKEETIPILVDVTILTDNRTHIEQNKKLFLHSREVSMNKKRYCINSEEHYRKEAVASQITKLLVEHINQAKLFSRASYGKNAENDFVLLGTLNSFYGEQEFSEDAVIGAKLGIVGIPPSKSPGKIVIEISDLRLLKKDGSQMFHFGNFRKEYTGNFTADTDCWCIYQNINEKLQDFNTQLIEKIRKDLSGAKR